VSVTTLAARGATDITTTRSAGRRSWTKRQAKIENSLMFIKAKALRGYTLDSRDGEIGTGKEFYFDDGHWTIRYWIDEPTAKVPAGAGQK
jgi:hypothetical protein